MSATPLTRSDGRAVSGSAERERRTPGRQLIAVTRDAALGQSLQELAGEISVVITDNLRDLTDQLLRHGSNLALLDAAALDAPVDGVVDSLIAQFPDLRLMVAGQPNEQNLLASRIASESVFRFVHKPASPQRLRLFLDAAARETGRPRGAVAALHTSPPRPPSKLAFTLAGLAAVLIAGVAAWLFWPHGAAARLNARDLGKVEHMLTEAANAMASQRFVSFDGSSAAELYRDVLTLDARNEQARAGLDRAISSAITNAQRALTEGKLDDATNSLEAVRQIAPDHQGVKELAAQVNVETQRALADTKAREQLQERQAQIHAALDRMTASLNSGALLIPESDNATTQFQTAQIISPSDPAVRAARSQLTGALVSAGEAAVADKRLGDARRYADAAGRVNSSASGLAALLWHIDEAAAPPKVAEKPVAPKPEPAHPVAAPAAAEPPVATNAAPATSSAPAVIPEPGPASVSVTAKVATPAPPQEPVWVPGEGVVSAGKLKQTRSSAAEYPEEARAAQISGWVELEFTVTKEGLVRDVEVTASEPKRTFDRAATLAVRRSRYEPVLKDGQPVEQRAAIRIRFTLQNQ